MKHSISLRFSTIVLALFVFPSHAQTAREIVNKYLDTVSNRDIHRWDSITSTYTESVEFYSQNNFDQKISFVTDGKPSYSKTYTLFRDKKVKTEMYSDSTYSKLSSRFYFLPSGSIVILGNQPPIKRSPSAKHNNMDFLPVQIWKLLNRCESLDLLGVKEFISENLSCYEIRMVVEDRIYMLYIDVTSYLLEYWNGREDQDLKNVTGFRNYKQVNGLLLPMTEFLKKNGVIFYQSDTKKFEVNPRLDPKIFDYKE
jgi:hypothetical protein